MTAGELIDRYGEFFLGMTVFSVLTVIVMATVGARLVVQLPADYFVNRAHRHQSGYLRRFPRVIQILGLVLKNVLGVVLVATGVILLLLPGQGVLTILAGIMLLDFPGKYACERWLVRRKALNRTITWFRLRAGKEPLVLQKGRNVG